MQRMACSGPSGLHSGGETGFGDESGNGRQRSCILWKTKDCVVSRRRASSCSIGDSVLSLSQASCTKGMERTSSCLSSPLSSGVSWAMGAGEASPAPAAMALLTATSSWPPWP